MLDMDMTDLTPGRGNPEAVPLANQIPSAPLTLEASGLRRQFLVDLLLKHFYQGGEMAAVSLSERLRLPLSLLMQVLDFMRVVRLLDVPQRGSFDADIRYGLSDAGRARAGEALERNRYVGPAPVTWAHYCEQVRRQSLSMYQIRREDLEQALATLAIDESLTEQLGAALNSGRGIYLHGPAGSGKTTLAEYLARCLGGSVLIPHAVLAGEDIIQLFDPLVHRVQPGCSAVVSSGPSLERDRGGDGRWVVCDRPAVFAGGELTLSMVELQLDPVNRYYTAPLQMKANNGLFIIDDLGRQKVPARELLNRWIVPLDRRVDFLGLHGGAKLELPFDVQLIFSSNLLPSQLDDAAFVRRLGYRIAMGAISPQSYRELLALACRREGLAYDEVAARYLVEVLHPRSSLPLLASHPFDVIARIGDRARYLGEVPQLNQASIDWAWRTFFDTYLSSATQMELQP
jgi:hypothetical protein